MDYPHTLVIETKPGSWGRGPDLKAALKAATYIGVGDRVATFRCTATAYVDEMGRMYGVDMATERRGKVTSVRNGTVKFDHQGPNQKGA